jgi:hypothetical protein
MNDINDIKKEIADLENQKEAIIEPMKNMTGMREILDCFKELRVINDKIHKLSKLL